MYYNGAGSEYIFMFQDFQTNWFFFFDLINWCLYGDVIREQIKFELTEFNQNYLFEDYGYSNNNTALY